MKRTAIINGRVATPYRIFDGATVLIEDGKILDVVRGECCTEGCEIIEGEKQDIIRIQMKYAEGKQRVITGIKRISKPGLKVYAKAADVPKVLGGLGIAIISTSSGLITDKEARKLGVGGEVICYVW